MATLVLKMSISLDGFVAASDGGSEWSAAGRSPDGAEWTLQTVANTVLHVMGSGAYRHWATSWPVAIGPFADAMNDLPKLVFSQSLTSLEWSGSTLERADATATIRRLKQELPEGYLLVQGGVRFARSLVESGLIDEYRLVVHPIFLGDGQRLFTAPFALEPTSTTVFSNGAVGHVFTAAPPG